MIKYYSKLQPPRVKRWSSFSCIALGFPFPRVVYYSSLWLESLLALQLPHSYTPFTLCQDSHSRVWGMLSAESPVCHLLRKRDGAQISAAKPSSPPVNDFQLLTLVPMPSFKRNQHLMMACLIFLGSVPDDYSVLGRGGSLLLSVGAAEHESSSYFLPISVFLNRSIYKRWKEGEF